MRSPVTGRLESQLGRPRALDLFCGAGLAKQAPAGVGLAKQAIDDGVSV